MSLSLPLKCPIVTVVVAPTQVSGSYCHQNANKMVLHPAPRTRSRRIVVNYTDDQEGLPIRDEDVIRAENGMWYTEEEERKFKNKSRAHCPTYGNCLNCLKCGPVGKTCNECDSIFAEYFIAFIWTRDGYSRIADAEYVARVVGKGSEIALADRYYLWHEEPTMPLLPEEFIDTVPEEMFAQLSKIFD